MRALRWTDDKVTWIGEIGEAENLPVREIPLDVVLGSSYGLPN